MTGAQKAFACLTLLVVALGVVQLTVFEALVIEDDMLPAHPSIVERVSLVLVNQSLRYIPFIVTVYITIQSGLLLIWAFRPPQPVSDHEMTARLLSQWLAWSLAVVGITVTTLLSAAQTSLGAGVLALWLAPLFGSAYCACMYRALQLQGYRERAGLSRLKASTLAVGAAFFPLLGPLWPLGLVLPFWVLRAAKTK